MKQVMVAATLLLAVVMPARAADLLGSGQMCALVGPSPLLAIDSNAELSDEVVRRMNEAVSVADSDRWIDSRRPAFTWASEAKVACGKAYGYLRNAYRDDDTINKCDCYHSRMIGYMY